MQANRNENLMIGRNLYEKKSLMQNSIQKIGLSLHGLVVLTELGTGDFAFTPILAKMAGARRVIVWTRDTKFGTATESIRVFQTICDALGFSNFFEIRDTERPSQDIRDANLITNLGMIRPIDSEFLQYVDSKNAVISLMFEAWEFRDQDLDLKFCNQRGIRVCGVNESDLDFPIFKFVGPLAAKMVLSAGYEIMENKIIIWSDDDFGHEISNFFGKLGAKNVVLTKDRDALLAHLQDTDILFFASYNEALPLISNGSGGVDCVLSLSELREAKSYPAIIHLYGKIKPVDLIDAGFTVFPSSIGSLRRMTRTLADVGSVPLLRLMAAGLRAGQEILNDETSRFSQKIIFGVHKDE
jgi:hypothetical protein